MKTDYHIECKKAERLKTLKKLKMPCDQHISKAHIQMANRICSLAITVFNDAKKLSLSAFTWPSRIVCGELAKSFDFNSSAPNRNSKLDLQYLNPTMHINILYTIVEAETQIIRDKLASCLAISLRMDGSVDSTNIDKIYVLTKIINETGDKETVFLSTGEQRERGAIGMMECVKSSLQQNFGNTVFIFQKTSSIVTDGANVNTGENIGLWKFLEYSHLTKPK